MRTLSAAGLIGLFVVGQGSACAPRPEEKPEPLDSGEAPLPTQERCDGLDNDLDGEVDEDASDALLWYADSDGDGYGDDADTLLACAAPSGYSAVGGDCAAEDSRRFPGAAEVCGGSDDADCDGLPGCEDEDCDGSASCPSPEVCDGLDNDLDGEVDEDAPDALLWYADSDGDGYGDDADTLLACAAPSGYSAVDGDCALEDPSRSPGAAEDCAASADLDCDGLAGCEDGDCMTDAACTEDCADGVDDDGDGLTDCWDDDCWPACGAIVRSSLKGGRMSMSTEQVKGSHSVGFQRLNGTAWSLSGHVEVVHATGSLDCDWTVPSARFWTRARQYLTWPHGSSADWKMASSSSGGHDSSVVTLSAGCPAPWAAVLPPTLSPGYPWPETPSGPWYSGEIAAKKVIYPYSSSHSLDGATIFYAVDTLSPATATWSY